MGVSELGAYREKCASAVGNLFVANAGGRLRVSKHDAAAAAAAGLVVLGVRWHP